MIPILPPANADHPPRPMRLAPQGGSPRPDSTAVHRRDPDTALQALLADVLPQAQATGQAGAQPERTPTEDQP
ncbi:hypothetical protein [Pseudooceanicola aestuarii]|uniref:hypothetical protein n=1 Tax=Pseudooceanicola aestuarii TaxID=2697319 RepID=UPI0013D7286C|nr:hypothetical protein [Pseudooceanicola aestuarii]